VRLTPSTVQALEGHRERQLEEKLRLAGLWKENGLVFTTAKGTPMDGAWMITLRTTPRSAVLSCLLQEA
jgi:hypothetical protein